VGVFLCLPLGHGWSYFLLAPCLREKLKFSKEGRGWRKAFVHRCSRAYRNASVARCVAQKNNGICSCTDTYLALPDVWHKRIMEYALVQIHILNDKIV